MSRLPSSDRDTAPAANAGGDKKICVARIGAAHGVRGEVRLWSFTEDPLSVADLGVLTTRDGSRSFVIASVREAKDHLVASFEGCRSREAAEALNRIELYVARSSLPAPDDDEFYYADLVGLRAVTSAGEPLGQVLAVHNFGAGDLIEVGSGAGGELLPFSRAVVPTIDIAGGFVVIERPTEVDAGIEGSSGPAES